MIRCYCTKSTKTPIKPMITVFVFGTKHKVKVTPKVAAKRKKVHPVEKNPRLQFFYPSSKRPEVNQFRDVRVIGANAKYVVGLQINDKNKFKKFLKAKMRVVNLAEFSPESVS